MGYDESLFSRLNDGWYSEKSNTMATLASEVDIYPGVQLPQRLNGGIFRVGSNIKADWVDISINNSTTADVQNNIIKIGDGENLDMSATHCLVNFDSWYELRLIVENNQSNIKFKSGSTELPFSKKGDNEYFVNLTSFNSKILDFIINGGIVNIKNIILICHTLKTGSGSTSIGINNINNLNNSLDKKVDKTVKIAGKDLTNDISLDINDLTFDNPISLDKIAIDNLTLKGSNSWVDNPVVPMYDFNVKQYMFKNLNIMLTVVTLRGRESTKLDFKESYSNVLPIAPKTVLACWGENKRTTVDSGLVNTNCSWSVNNNSKNVTFIYYQGSIHTLSWDFFMLSIQ